MPDARASTAESHTVCVTVLTPFLRLCEEAGPQTEVKAYRLMEEILTARGISVASIEADPNQRLPWTLLLELYRAVLKVLDDPAAPLMAGARGRPGDFQLLDYLCRSCNTVGESIEHIGRYIPLVIEADYELVIEGDHADVRNRFPFEFDGQSGWHEFMAAYFTTMSIHYLKPLDHNPLQEVCFTHRAPAYVDRFQSVFAAPVHFNCEHNGARFETAFLRHPMRTADPILHDILVRVADAQLEMIPRLNAFTVRVRDAVQKQLGEGATLESVAALLNVSPGTLRRRLREHGTTFTSLLDDVRREQTRRLLRQPEQNIAEIAYRLGFAHPPAFHRACKRWFQQSPSEYRTSLVRNPVSHLWRQR